MQLVVTGGKGQVATPSTMVNIKFGGGGGGVEGAKLTKLPNFCTFLNWYFICYKIQSFRTSLNSTIFSFLFSHFAQIVVPFSKPLSA